MIQSSNYCPLCQRNCGPAETIGTVDTTHPGPFSRDSFELLHCRQCDVVRLDPIPTAADLNVLYRDSEQFSDAIYTDDARVQASLEYYGTCLDNFGLMPEAGDKSLEVGAGLAWVSRAVKMRDEGVITVAQDVTAECVERCPWVDDYRVGRITDIGYFSRFKLISLTHVIEHLPNPAEVISQLAKRLRTGGRLLITAPYRPVGWSGGGGLDAWKQYSYLHVPAHISYLSRPWFEGIASRCRLRMIHWDQSSEDGQAFEVVLEKVPPRVVVGLKRLLAGNFPGNSSGDSVP